MADVASKTCVECGDHVPDHRDGQGPVREHRPGPADPGVPAAGRPPELLDGQVPVGRAGAGVPVRRVRAHRPIRERPARRALSSRCELTSACLLVLLIVRGP